MWNPSLEVKQDDMTVIQGNEQDTFKKKIGHMRTGGLEDAGELGEAEKSQTAGMY